MHLLRSATATALVCLFLTTCRTDEELAAPPTPSAAFTAAPGTAVLVGAGNIASCKKSGDEATAALLDSTLGTVFTAGDNAYDNGSIDRFLQCYDPNWGRHKARTRPAPGDRDYRTAGATGYFTYFGAAADGPSQGYYSYDLGAWHVIVLNSSIATSAGSAQEQWLRAELTAHATPCTIAYWHHPLFFSKGTSGTNTAVQPLWDALYAAGVEVVVNAHYAFYERFAAQTPAAVADAAFGIREFVVGTGGAEIQSFGTIRANSEVRSSGTAGVLRLVLDSGAYTWEFLPIAGRTFRDSGTGACHPAPPAPNQPPIARPGGPYTGEDTIHFDGTTSYDPDNDLPLDYVWQYGDGSTGTGPTPTHVYTADGTYSVALTVTDAKGAPSVSAATTATILRPSRAVVLVGAGNIARCDRTGDEETAALLDGIAGTVMTMGDNAYPGGSTTDYAACYDPTWGRHRSRTRPGLGNHDYDTGSADPYFAYFGAAAGDAASGYYSYDLATWHIIVVNTGSTAISTAAGAPQEQWLRADLAAHPARCTLAYWHHPRFYQGTWGKNSAVKPLWDALYAANADVVVNGHFHLYERYAPQTPDGVVDSARGIRQFIAGTGGAGHDALVEPHPNVEVRDNTAVGVLKLTLRDGAYDWEFIPAGGATFSDRGSGT